MKRLLSRNVFDAALERLRRHFVHGDRVVVSFSGGKDSCVCLNLALRLAEETGRLPLDVTMRDEEALFPGTFEYCERVAADSRVRMHWLVAHQPIVNIFNRAHPYWWVFDPEVPSANWMRPYPSYGYDTPHLEISYICHWVKEEFPPGDSRHDPGGFACEEGKSLINIVGLRAQESGQRAKAMASSLGYLTRKYPERGELQLARPIYDWTMGDVWRAIRENGWDYNHAYDAMLTASLPEKYMRIAPPTLNQASVGSLNFAMRTWPQWFDQLNNRLPGVRTAAMFGLAAVRPLRHSGESWQDVFQRDCLREAPASWIRERAQRVMEQELERHAHHSALPIPEEDTCPKCGTFGSWKRLALFLWNGDPMLLKTKGLLPPMQPEFFRPGAGTWYDTDAVDLGLSYANYGAA